MIAIIDDEKAARDELSFLICKYFSQMPIVEFNSGHDFLDYTDKDKLAIIFLDIHLGDIDGLLIAKMIKELNSDVVIVLVTAYDKYALKSYEIGIFDYITKPIIEKRFEKLVNRIESETNVLKSKNISFTTNKVTYVINVDDIIYIEFVDRKINIITKTNTYNTSMSLNKILTMLPANIFFRTHKSYVVNTNYIESIEQAYTSYYDINLMDLPRVKIPVSRTKIKELKLLLNII